MSDFGTRRNDLTIYFMIQFQTCQERLKVATGGGMVVMSLSPDSNPGMCTEIMENGMFVSICTISSFIVSHLDRDSSRIHPCFCIVQDILCHSNIKSNILFFCHR